MRGLRASIHGTIFILREALRHSKLLNFSLELTAFQGLKLVERRKDKTSRKSTDSLRPQSRICSHLTLQKVPIFGQLIGMQKQRGDAHRSVRKKLVSTWDF